MKYLNSMLKLALCMVLMACVSVPAFAASRDDVGKCVFTVILLENNETSLIVMPLSLDWIDSDTITIPIKHDTIIKDSQNNKIDINDIHDNAIMDITTENYFYELSPPYPSKVYNIKLLDNPSIANIRASLPLEDENYSVKVSNLSPHYILSTDNESLNMIETDEFYNEIHVIKYSENDDDQLYYYKVPRINTGEESFSPGFKGTDPRQFSVRLPEEERQYTENIKIKVVDEKGLPVGNICVNLIAWDDSKFAGSYTPGDALTSTSTGSAPRKAYPGMYDVILSDRKQLDYEGITQRNQVIQTIEVKGGVENEFTFVWKLPTPQELDLATEEKVTLTFLDTKGKPVSDLWVTLNPADDNSPEPEQIIWGITDQNGSVYWPNGFHRSFIGGALLPTDDNHNDYIAGKNDFEFEVKTGTETFTFIWEPKE